MSFLEDVEKFMKNKTTVATENYLDLTKNEVRKAIENRLRSLYDNATSREIDKAINCSIEKLGETPSSKEFYLFVRPLLED